MTESDLKQTCNINEREVRYMGMTWTNFSTTFDP